MSELAQRLAGLSPAKRQLLEKRLAEPPPPAEPIAIIGMACRFPGAANLEAFWRLIRDRISAVREIPPDRWNAGAFYDPTGEAAGKMSVRWAALIDGPDQFDPQFFGITPREAVRMDPQQRLLLEVAWEAMENAGRPSDELAGSRTGVFVGIGGTDYSKIGVPYDDYYQQIDAHMGTGNALSIAANRLSYIFDFHGPSAAVDTACSSSSLAVHLAVESLRRRESDTALAGGVNMILSPETTIAFSKARMLSPQGVCRPFDAAADGYVRGEGCGLVLLKRLADAEADGDNVLAIIRATSVNQDGRTSGISAPNGQSQMACIRAALRQAGLSPDEISCVEAHGTGTPLGDPIEIQALGEIFRRAEPGAESGEQGAGSTEQGTLAPRSPLLAPCYVSSVKANVGHMETVSGVAGLIRVVLSMQHELIAPQTHFESLNPHIDLAGTRLVIPTEPVAWPRERRRIAGVSSFGFGGTNTHLIVEGPGELASASGETERPIHLLKLSAKSEAALAKQADDLAVFLADHSDAAAADACWSANTGRADFNHRGVVIAKDAGELQARLKDLAAGQLPAGTKQATVRALGRPHVALLFTGQGSQYVGMGRELYESHPEFRSTLNLCDQILSDHWGGKSLLSILYPNDSAADDPHAAVHQTEFTQPALFAIEVALARLWQSWGVVPDVVLGHSVGEYAAACIAGVMSLEDGLALIAERAALMQRVKRRGKMCVVFAPQDRVARAVADTNGEVVVAVVNGPENTVMSGEAAAVERLAARFEAEGVRVQMLNVSHAFHSPLMEEILDEFERYAAEIEFHAPQVPLAANLTGRLMTDAPTGRYWRDHLRNTVQFAAGMDRIAEAKPAVLIEIGPTASLLGMGRRCLPALEAAWLPSLRQGQADWQVLAGSVAEFYVRGGRIDWRGWDAPWRRTRLAVPNYPFERSRQWFEFDPSRRRVFADGEAGQAALAVGSSSDHPLLGARLSTVWSNALFEMSLSARSPAYLIDHQVQGSAVTPAAAYVEQGLAAAEQLFGPGRHGVANLVIQQAMFLPEGARRRVQLSLSPESGGQSTFESYSRPADGDDAAAAWTMHAAGRLVHESSLPQRIEVSSLGEPASAGAAGANNVDLEAARGRAVSILSGEAFYQVMRERGLAYGPAFQVLAEMCHGTDDAVAQVALPESVVREAGRYRLHPALGDALLQSVAGAVPLEHDGSYSPYTYMPVAIRQVLVLSSIDSTQPMFTYAVRTSQGAGPSPERVSANVYLVNSTGDVLVAMEGVEVQRVGRAGGDAAASDTRDWLYRVAWQPAPLGGPASGEVASATGRPGTPASTGAWLIFADRRGVADALAEQLAQRGQASTLFHAGDTYQAQTESSGNGHPGRYATATIDPLDEEHYARLFGELFGNAGRPCLGVVHLWSLDIPSLGVAGVERQRAPSLEAAGGSAEPRPQPPSDCEWESARRVGCGGVLQLVRALARASLPTPTPALWLVTCGAQAVDGVNRAPLAVEQSPLVGLGRVAAMELPDLKPRLVDLDPASGPQHAANGATALIEELIHGATDGEVAYRDNERFVARLVRDPAAIADPATSAKALSVPSARPFQLRITQAGSFDALRFTPVERQPPQAGQVEIEIHATGLNFSDVLKALGLYPGITDAIVPLGIEASGVVTAVGDGVDRFKIGDEVFGVVPYAFASHARTAEYALAHKPASIEHDQACTIPITFLTAYYGLVRLAQLRPGERVLVHAGAGGVGLAAIQIAQHVGAEVFATAGSDQKRDFLRSLGVKHVYSSRTVDFADEILADTDRQGVDVVLNSLPGEAITKSLAILRAYGRFLEIGKTDIYQNRMIGLLPFQDNLSYFAIDLDRMLRERPDCIRELFAEVMEQFADGHYEPLVFTRFEADGTIDAFRYMSQRKNIGKVVVAMESREQGAGRTEQDEPAACSTLPAIRRDGTYLITGGLGALGLRVAGWLAERGAGTIALMARRSPSAEVEARLAAIRELGANIIAIQSDVTDADSLAAALRQLPADKAPLRGVVHAAGALADGVLSDMTLDQLDRAMVPKVAGAWNLHTATRDEPLDFFVLFSSVASVLGSPGQANYAAGNAMLDALAHARRAAGLPATAINWGPWAGSGMAVDAGLGDARPPRGMNLIPPELGLDLLGKILAAEVPQLAVMDAQWSELLQLLGSRRPALLDDVAAEVEQSTGGDSASQVDHAFRQQILEAEGAGRHALVCNYIRQELARVMGVAEESLEFDQPLSAYGLDSLLALELKNNLERRLDFTLPMAKLIEGPSIATLAAETARLVAGGTGAGASAGGDGEHGEPEAWNPLLAMRAAGAKPPLVLLPPLGGDVSCYTELVDQLGSDRPVYVFRLRGFDEDLPPHATMAERVADYMAALRRLQPTGPYHLAGWSLGGIHAFALAEALEQAGDDVGLLAMFDTPTPSICDDVDLEDDAGFLFKLISFANRVAGANLRVDYDALGAMSPDERFTFLLGEARRHEIVSAEASESIIRRLVRVGEANVRSIQGFTPRRLDLTVHCFVPTTKGALLEVAEREIDESGEHSWRVEVGQQVEMHEVTGDHFTMMFGEGAAQIARRLALLLDAQLAVPRS